MNSKIFFHWIKYVISLQTLTKADAFDKSLMKRTRITTTTTKSILRPLPQYLLTVKNDKVVIIIEVNGYSLLRNLYIALLLTNSNRIQKLKWGKLPGVKTFQPLLEKRKWCKKMSHFPKEDNNWNFQLFTII